MDTAHRRLTPLPGRSPRVRAGPGTLHKTWGWSANAGGAPGQQSGGGNMPQTSAPAGAQSATAGGT
eukprot:967597-Alexandrium_andersonii.AAC.1